MTLGVLLVQLGGPARREELRPFLYELFADPEVLGIPFAPLRKLVAWTIATTRAPKSAKTYEAIGWSPIRCHTERQGMLLQERLGSSAVVTFGMTCSHPMVEASLEELRAKGVTDLLVLPLYPQYSVTTTRGSYTRVREGLKAMGWSPRILRVPDAWYDEPHFVAAHADLIEKAAATLPEKDPAKTVVLYSAHSLPVSTVVKQKDPYPKHIEATVAAIDAALGGRFRSRLGYQSKVGPVAWLGPATQEVLADLAKDGVTQVVCAPIAFVSDHVETLYEIRMLFADEAKRLGISHFVAAEGLNEHPGFLACLESLVRSAKPEGT